MATRPYVPRADGEASIGVATKKWGNIFAYKIDEATNLGNNAGLGYRQPSTAQTIGDVKYHATLPAGWFLECTTAGTTGSGTLTITTPTVGGTVSDGTVTWTIRKNASTQDLTGYLPLSGGAMTGTNLTWNGNSLDKSAVVAESLGDNGYRKYASGLIVQWGQGKINQNSSSTVIDLPISSTATRRVLISKQGWDAGADLYWADTGTNTASQIEIKSTTPITHQYGQYFSWLMYTK